MALGNLAGTLVGAGANTMAGRAGSLASGAQLAGSLSNQQDSLNQMIGFNQASSQMNVAADAQLTAINTDTNAKVNALSFSKDTAKKATEAGGQL